MTDSVKKLIDEFGELHHNIGAQMDRYDALKKLLQAEANLTKSELPIVLEGSIYVVDYSASAKENKCLVDPEQFLGETALWDALKVSTTEARNGLSKGQFDELFASSLGGRRMKRVRIG